MKRVWMTCALLLSTAGAARAEPLFRIVGPSAGPTPRTLIADAVDRHAIALDDATLARDPARLSFALPDGRAIDVERARHLVHGPDLESWSGTIPSFDPAREAASYVRFTRRRSGTTGVVILPDGDRFEVLPDGRGGHELVRVARAPTAPTASCGMASATGKPTAVVAPLAPALAAPPAAAVADKAAAASLLPPEPALFTAALGTVTIDLLAIYPDRFLTTEPEAKVQAFIQDSVIDANEIFWNTGVDAQYVLRYMGPITAAQPPATGIQSALGWLNTSSHPEIDLLRNAYGADAVALFMPLSDTGTQACGIANLPTTGTGCVCEGSTSSFAQRAFSVVRSGCGITDFTVAHELGHNFGMWHELGNPIGSPTLRYSYARGHTVQSGVKATVMACTGQLPGPIENGVCHRIPYFSDPTLTVDGFPVGSAGHNNASVADQEVGAMAAFRPTRTTGVPTVRINAPGRGATFSGGTNVTFSATASDPEQGNLTSAIRWTVDGGLVATTGGTLVTAFATAGAHTVTASVTDNTNVSAEWTVPLTVVVPPTTSVAWIIPAEASFGPPGTLTVAGHAQNGSGGVQLRWRDATAGGAWSTVPYQPVPSGGTWVNSIPATTNNCHTYQAQSVYSSVSSSIFTYTGLTSGYCTETARVIWIQPQPLAGFGPPGSLVVAGEARNAPAGYGVRLSYRDVTANGAWIELAYAPGPDMTGIWYNAIPNAIFTHQYAVRVVYDVITSSTCTYAGANAVTWC